MTYFYSNRPILIPPDPKNPLNPAPDYLNELEASGKYIAEQKWNGDNTLIFTDRPTEFWNRTKARLKYTPPPEMVEELRRWPKGCLINAELVDHHTTTVKNKLIVHCIMSYKNKPLLGKTWGDSRHILEDMPGGSLVIVSPVWTTGFWDLFQAADGKVIEGIILKNPKGKLVFSTTPLADVSYMLKVRKSCKKYSF
jgi:hypothetical protein